MVEMRKYEVSINVILLSELKLPDKKAICKIKSTREIKHKITNRYYVTNIKDSTANKLY